VIKRIKLSVGLWALLLAVLGGIVGVTFLRERFNPDFKSRGIEVGERIPELMVTTQHGAQQSLARLWQKRPVLLVTGSLTCPVSRREIPSVEGIRKKFGDRVFVAVLYTQEAHPSAGPFPYEDHGQPKQNRIEGLARAQPRTLEERGKLADEFKDRLRLSVPVVLDDMRNQAWETFGGGPNMALLVDRDGVVHAKQGWFDDDEMQEEIERFLGL